jgi:hypothetical protein
VIGVAVAGASAVSASFAAGAAKAGPATSRKVRHFGMLLQTRVRANASGRPGPNAPTGDYRRSIAHEHQATGDHATSYVGTNAPQGARLEFGFHGEDSLGRHYDQPPYPHFGPAVDQIEGPFEAAMTTIVTEVT